MWQIPHQRAAAETREAEQTVVKTHRERSTSDKVLPVTLTSNACSSACRCTPNDPSCCSSLCPSCPTVTICRWSETKAEMRTVEICQKMTMAVVLKIAHNVKQDEYLLCEFKYRTGNVCMQKKCCSFVHYSPMAYLRNIFVYSFWVIKMLNQHA